MITPCMRVYSHWNGFLAGSDSGMVVYRSDVGMAFRHDFSLSTMSVLRNLTFNCGAAYRWIASMPATVPVNPQNLDLYVGLSDWL